MVATIAEQPFTVAKIPVSSWSPSTRWEGAGGGPSAGIRNRHSPFLSQGLCGATTDVP